MPNKGMEEHNIRFTGRLLAGQTISQKDRGKHFRVYQTKAGKILIWWKIWSAWGGESDLLVLNALPGHGEHLPPETLPGSLLQEAAEALGEELVEYVE